MKKLFTLIILILNLSNINVIYGQRHITKKKFLSFKKIPFNLGIDTKIGALNMEDIINKDIKNPSFNLNLTLNTELISPFSILGLNLGYGINILYPSIQDTGVLMHHIPINFIFKFGALEHKIRPVILTGIELNNFNNRYSGFVSASLSIGCEFYNKPEKSKAHLRLTPLVGLNFNLTEPPFNRMHSFIPCVGLRINGVLNML